MELVMQSWMGIQWIWHNISLMEEIPLPCFLFLISDITWKHPLIFKYLEEKFLFIFYKVPVFLLELRII